MTCADRLYVAVVIVAVLALSTAPYVMGYASQMPERIFDGAVFDLPDYHTHLGEMQLGLRGEWLHRVLSTPEDHDGALMRTFYIALGQVARCTGLSLPLVYQLARIVFGALFLVAAHRFIAAFQPTRTVHRLALALVAFSSGLGWLVQIVAPAGPNGISPIDFWLIDANSFFSIMIFPHFTAAMTLLLEISIRLIEQLKPPALGVSTRGIAACATTALFAFLLTTIHPYAIAIIIGPAMAFGVMQLIRRRGVPARWWWLVSAAMAGAAPVLLYSAIVFIGDPVFQQWAAQNITLSPPPIYYVLGFGLVLVFALLGVRRFVRECGDRAVFVLIWIGVACVMLYFPVGIQRRFAEGLHVPLCLVAAYGLARLSERMSARVSFVVINFILALASMSNVYMVIGYTTLASMRSEKFFHPADRIAAINWLGAHSSPDETVLASESVGSLIPARIGHRVVLGHWAETVDYRGKQAKVTAFFNAVTSDAERLAMLKRLGVRYVYHGPDERALGAFDPSRAPYLAQAFRAGDVTLYRVELP